jgi:hypothetical protein
MPEGEMSVTNGAVFDDYTSSAIESADLYQNTEEMVAEAEPWPSGLQMLYSSNGIRLRPK